MNTGKRLKNVQCPTPTRNKFAGCKYIFSFNKFAVYKFYIYRLLLIGFSLAIDFRGHISSNRSQQITIDASKSSTQWHNIKKNIERSKFDPAVIEPKRLFGTDDEGILFFVVRASVVDKLIQINFS